MVQSAGDCIIMDNGAYSVRIGTSRDVPKVIPNCLFKSKNDRKRVFVGNEIDECVDRSSLFYVYAFERGYLVNWDVEQQVWDRCLAPYLSKASDSKLVMTDLNYLIPAIKDQSNEIIFEHYEFGQLYKNSASSFSAMAAGPVALVIDVGFSCTTIAPFLDGKPIPNAVLRIDLGGKVLTNQLKDWISYRDVNVMEETYVVNECKEDACFVSLDFDADMEIARQRDSRNTIRREYVLPDFLTQTRGFIRVPGSSGDDQHQCISVNHERFALPEALFRPSNMGIEQMGVAEAAAESIGRCPSNLRPALARNIVLVGGSSKFPNFKERLIQELSSFTEWDVSLLPVVDPITHSWSSAKDAVVEGQLRKKFVTRQQWAENGDAISKRFVDFADC